MLLSAFEDFLGEEVTQQRRVRSQQRTNDVRCMQPFEDVACAGVGWCISGITLMQPTAFDISEIFHAIALRYI